jgi:hypothetical protein
MTATVIGLGVGRAAALVAAAAISGRGHRRECAKSGHVAGEGMTMFRSSTCCEDGYGTSDAGAVKARVVLTHTCMMHVS